MSVSRIVFPNARLCIHGAEWALARDNDISVRRDCEIEGAQFGIRRDSLVDELHQLLDDRKG